jgi:hypothetical protein
MVQFRQLLLANRGAVTAGLYNDNFPGIFGVGQALKERPLRFCFR